MKQMLKLASDH